uniref:Small ribosomal subunit protein bS6c n=1 Tax=Corynoplastis japonica TaxID=700918 RepID=A0A1X9PTW9_9RHOD|nr:30S ribosomal protein S6 [Corynoplastis japonica]
MITTQKQLVLTKYETIIILKSDLSEDNITELIDKYQEVLAKNHTKNIFIQNRGRRHLIYPIKQYHDGIFIQINYEANGILVNLFAKLLKFDENVLRFMTIKNMLEKL